MRITPFLIILLELFCCVNIQGQNYYRFVGNETLEHIRFSEYMPLSSNPASSIKIDLTPGNIKFIIQTENPYFFDLATSLEPNKMYDLPIQLNLSNGSCIKCKSPGMNSIKILAYDYIESSCEFEINIFSLYTDASGNTPYERNESFFKMLKDNDIKSLSIDSRDLFTIPFDRIKTSKIIKQMADCFTKEESSPSHLSSSTSSTPSISSTLSSKEDNIKRVVNFVRFLIDKPWGCLDDKDIKKSQFKQSIIEKNYFKTLENDWDELDKHNEYVDGRGYEPISGYYLMTPQELRVNDIHILPTVTFAGEKLIAYKYSIYLSERYDMNDANMVMSSIAQNLGLKKTGKFKTYKLGYILRGSCLYGKYKDSKIFISEPDKISDYFINIYIIKDKRQSLIQ